MQIKFHGAAQTVTGSQHLITVNGKKFLLDCGLFQGRRKDTAERNRSFSANPKDIEAVVLSHAHADHAANLPNLVKHGFDGPIHATNATEDMAEYMLRDSGRIQESDARYINKKRAKRGEPPIEAMYTEEDALEALQLFNCHDYHTEFEVMPGVTATFSDAGHILGSAITTLTLEEKGKKYRIGFSGDIGRNNKPILRDPEKLDVALDALLMESTYGNRNHNDPGQAIIKLEKTVKDVVRKGGKLVIPSFAVGRSQDIVYWLHQLMDSGRIPRIPVFVDSPLTSNISKIFSRHEDLYDRETQDFMGLDHKHGHDGPLRYPELHYTASVDESKAINHMSGPLIVISASGMVETGRIVHHVRNTIEQPENTILIVSWQAPHTLGRRLVEKKQRIKIWGDEFHRKADVQIINGLSAHADEKELIEWCNPLKGRVGKIFLVHGELTPQQNLKARLNANNFEHVYIPKQGDTFDF